MGILLKETLLYKQLEKMEKGEFATLLGTKWIWPTIAEENFISLARFFKEQAYGKYALPTVESLQIYFQKKYEDKNFQLAYPEKKTFFPNGEANKLTTVIFKERLDAVANFVSRFVLARRIENLGLNQTFIGRHPWKPEDFIEYLRKNLSKDDDELKYAHAVFHQIHGEKKVDQSEETAWKVLVKATDSGIKQLDDAVVARLPDFQYTFKLRQEPILRLWPTLTMKETDDDQNGKSIDPQKEFFWFIERPGKKNLPNLKGLLEILRDDVLEGIGLSKELLLEKWLHRTYNDDNLAMLGRAIDRLNELMHQFLVLKASEENSAGFELQLLQAMVSRNSSRDLIQQQIEITESEIEELPRDDGYYLEKLRLEQTRVWIERSLPRKVIRSVNEFSTLLMLQNACIVLNWLLSSKIEEKDEVIIKEVHALVNNLQAWKFELGPAAELYWNGMHLLVAMAGSKGITGLGESDPDISEQAYHGLKSSLERCLQRGKKLVSDGVLHDAFTICNNYLTEAINTAKGPISSLIREMEALFVLRCEQGDWKTVARKISSIDLRNLILSLIRDHRKDDADVYFAKYSDRLDSHSSSYTVEYLALIVQYATEDKEEDSFVESSLLHRTCNKKRDPSKLVSLKVKLELERNIQMVPLAKAEAWVYFWRTCFLLQEHQLINKEKGRYTKFLRERLSTSADQQSRYLNFKTYMTGLVKQASKIEDIAIKIESLKVSRSTPAQKRKDFRSYEKKLGPYKENLEALKTQLQGDQSVSKDWLLKKIDHTVQKIGCLTNEIGRAIEKLKKN